MITSLYGPNAAARRKRHQAGLTLAETMVSSGVFALAVMGLIYGQMFGMRMDQLANSKVGASELARLSFNEMANDIRAAKIWEVGNGNQTTFTPIGLGTNQQGNALKLCMTTDTNKFYVYYFDTAGGALYRRHTGESNPQCCARFLTNSMYFQAQNYRGTIQTDRTHKGVIAVMMQFCQYQYPITRIGPGLLYDSYQMEMRVTPHVPDGP